MSPSVLVVEDYADLRSAISSALSREEYTCDCADSTTDAIAKLHQHDYDTILIAPRIPITNDPVLHYLAKFRPEQMSKVIVMSDRATPTEGSARIEKPFTNAALFELIKSRG